MKALKPNSRNLRTQSAQRTDPRTLSELLPNTHLEAGDLPALGYPPATIAQWRSDGVL